MKADHGRADLGDDIGRVIVEAATARSSRDGVWVDAELQVVRRERFTPSRLSCGVEDGCRMAEEVDVERTARSRGELTKLFAKDVGSEHGSGKGAERACLADRCGK